MNKIVNSKNNKKLFKFYLLLIIHDYYHILLNYDELYFNSKIMDKYVDIFINALTNMKDNSTYLNIKNHVLLNEVIKRERYD